MLIMHSNNNLCSGTASAPVNAHLTRKYDIHFNFFLTKPTNELLFNHTTAPTTIAYKDHLILADSNEYLKRYYFLTNASGKDEIYDRINLLAEFYANAVLLKYEYPMMVLTRTRAIFLKRLKRMKKILAEEGSSDESNSIIESEKAVFVNSSQFLKSVSDSELQRKSQDEGSNLQLQFSLLNNTPEETHNIYDQNEEDEEVNKALFLANINRLTQSIGSEFTLRKEGKEEELRHLVVDFDEIDHEEIISRYRQLLDKENKAAQLKSQVSRQQEMTASNKPNSAQAREKVSRKPMAESATVFAQPNVSKKDIRSPGKLIEERTDPMKGSYYQGQGRYYYQRNYGSAIPEDEGEWSPASQKHSPKQRRFTAKHHQFKLGSPQRQYLAQAKPNLRDFQANRERIMERHDYNLPPMKYSAIQYHEDIPQTREKPRYSQFQRQEQNNYPFFPHEDNYQYDANQHYSRDQYSNPPMQRVASHPSLASRLTSINININNLQEKKEEARFNLNLKKNKMRKQDHFQQPERHEQTDRAEKKRKIRERAAALLSRVKSQEYLRGECYGQYDYGLSYGTGYHEPY